MRFMRRLWRRREGASAVEFALVALPMFMTAIGIIEVAMVLFVNVLLEGAVRDAARFGITGYVPQGTDRAAVIRNIVQEYTVGLIDMSKVDIETLVYSNFSNIGQPEPFTDANGNGAWDAGEVYVDVNGNGQWDPDMGAAGVGGPGDVVLYTVTYDWSILTGLFKDVLGTNGEFTLRASVAVRNEPYPVPAGG
jgi:Flp pilus assembly protein TadG